jgi:hypothetical protein
MRYCVLDCIRETRHRIAVNQIEFPASTTTFVPTGVRS